MKQLSRLGLIIAGVLVASAMLAGAVTFSVHAQGLECYEPASELITRVNPFTGQVETVTQYNDQFDEDCAFIQDGRVNNYDLDAGAAIYCNQYGIAVYDLDISGNGTWSFAATWSEVEDVPEFPEENTLIDGNHPFALYRLTTGEMQLNGVTEEFPPKPYVYIWDGCERPQ